MSDLVPRETRTTFDFTGLTETQQMLLTVGGWAPGTKIVKQPQPRTVQKLLDRGLLVARDFEVFGITVKAYSVPTTVHMAWCHRCADTHGAKP